MPRLTPVRVCDVSDWQPVGEEPRGKRAKYWVHGENADWLRKEPRDLRPTEPAIETLTLRLADAAAIPAAESQLAVWATAGESKRGIVVRRFLDEKLET